MIEIDLARIEEPQERLHRLSDCFCMDLMRRSREGEL